MARQRYDVTVFDFFLKPFQPLRRSYCQLEKGTIDFADGMYEKIVTIKKIEKYLKTERSTP